MKRNQIKYIERFNIRQKALKVILIVLLACLAIDTITGVLNSSRVVSISNLSEVQASEMDSTSSEGTPHVAVGATQPSEDIMELIKKYFPDETNLAYAIMMAESQGDPKIIGDKHLAKPSVGLFQICQIWHPYKTEDLQKPEFNIKVASEIRAKGGWERWTTFRNGSYKKYL